MLTPVVLIVLVIWMNSWCLVFILPPADIQLAGLRRGAGG